MCYDPLRFILCFVVCHPLLISFDSSHLSLSLSLSLLLRLFNLFPFLFLALFFLLGSSPTLFFQKKMFCFVFCFFFCSSPHVSCLRREREMERKEGKGERQLLSFLLHPVAFPCLSLFLFSPLWGLPFPFRTIPPLRSWAFFSPFFLQFGAFPFLSFPSLSGFTPLSLSGFPSPFCFHFRASGFPCPFGLSSPFLFFLVGFPSPFPASPFSFRLFLSLFYSVFPILFRAFSFHFRPLLLAFPFRALPCPFSLFPFLLGLSLPFFIPLLAFPSCF